MSIYNPTNEQEAILNFVRREEVHKFEIINFWSSFPDARIRDTQEDIFYEVEFEYMLSSFIKHGHDPFRCNFVICWENDIPYFHFPLTVWEIKSNSYPDILHPSESELITLSKIIKSKRFRKYDYRNR